VSIYGARLLSLSCTRAPRNSSFNSLGSYYLLASLPSTRRSLSLGSIFSRSKPEPTPTPQVVALITRLEAEANVHPHDVSKQLALLDALADTKLKSSYELVVNRWQKMCEFVSDEMDFVLAVVFTRRDIIRIHLRLCSSRNKLSRSI